MGTIPVYFAVAAAFYRRGLFRSYFFFILMLLAEGITLAVSYLAGDDRSDLRLIYLVSQPPTWAFYVLMVLEVFRKVFVHFPGIASLARRTLAVLLVLAFLFSVVSIGKDFSIGWAGQSLISRYSVIFRTISSALCLFMIFVVAFLAWMPVPLPRNTVIHSLLLFFYFFVSSAVHYVVNTDVHRVTYLAWANLMISSLTLTALLSWLFLLRPEGESSTRPRPAAIPDGGEMLSRLESMAGILEDTKTRGSPKPRS